MNWIRYLLFFIIGMLLVSIVVLCLQYTGKSEKKVIQLFDLVKKNVVGKATLYTGAGQTVIDVTLVTRLPKGQAVSIIEGTCAQMGDIVYHLNQARLGWANSTINVPLHTLIGKHTRAIVVHSKLLYDSEIIACGNL